MDYSSSNRLSMAMTPPLAVRFWLFVVTLVLITIGAESLFAQDHPLYLDRTKPIDARIDDLLPRLSLEEKISLVHANSIFTVAGVPRLGIPELSLHDGPMGVRQEVDEKFQAIKCDDDFATAMPATIGLAASFNTDLANQYGSAVGEEARQRHKNILLGPSLNIQRTPLCGRNFEYLGEDPCLAAQIAVHFIHGVQAQGVASCVKHFAANNQETQRNHINVEMDERALREIYLPAFRASVQEAGALCVMGAYNLFRGQHCCENDYLLNKILKGEWGFRGVVLSDWGGVHNTEDAALNGMDLEMGTSPPYENNFLASPFLEGLKSGKYPTSLLNDKVRRHLHVMFKLDMIHDPAMAENISPEPKGGVSTKEHQDLARRVAEESIVLLKNDGLLPLKSTNVKTIAVIGANATAKFAIGGGSASMKSPYEITALDGIKHRLGDTVKIIYARGYNPTIIVEGQRNHARSAVSSNNDDANLIDEAVAEAKSADVAIYIGGLNHNGGYDTENTDRPDLKLPGNQDYLIEKIIAANPKTVVVFIGGGAVEMESWLSQAPAVLYAWYPGMEGGNALARVLFGDVNPSGKLPCTFPKRLIDSPAHALNAFPGDNGTETYEEGLLVGYRWFDTKNIEPLFPFGHGLSYTNFKYSSLKLIASKDTNSSILTVEFDLTNTGEKPGAEASQIYIQDVESRLPRPMKELKGFVKTSLNPGEKKKISVPLDRSALAYYDPDQKGWVAEAGDFNILIGSSSRDIRLIGTFTLLETTIEK